MYKRGEKYLFGESASESSEEPEPWPKAKLSRPVVSKLTQEDFDSDLEESSDSQNLRSYKCSLCPTAKLRTLTDVKAHLQTEGHMMKETEATEQYNKEKREARKAKREASKQRKMMKRLKAEKEEHERRVQQIEVSGLPGGKKKRKKALLAALEQNLETSQQERADLYSEKRTSKPTKSVHSVNAQLKAPSHANKSVVKSKKSETSNVANSETAKSSEKKLLKKGKKQKLTVDIDTPQTPEEEKSTDRTAPLKRKAGDLFNHLDPYRSNSALENVQAGPRDQHVKSSSLKRRLSEENAADHSDTRKRLKKDHAQKPELEKKLKRIKSKQ